jgi:hypothetical protein
MLREETARTLGDWIYEDILCWWGSLREIVTDNSPAFLKAMEYLSKRWNTYQSATISITYASAATTLAPMVW